jgi:hypothetical protein
LVFERVAVLGCLQTCAIGVRFAFAMEGTRGGPGGRIIVIDAERALVADQLVLIQGDQPSDQCKRFIWSRRPALAHRIDREISQDAFGAGINHRRATCMGSSDVT